MCVHFSPIIAAIDERLFFVDEQVIPAPAALVYKKQALLYAITHLGYYTVKYTAIGLF